MWIFVYCYCNKQTPCGQIHFHACLANMLTQEAYYGVPTYMGPEVLRNFETLSAAFDVWSHSCVIAFFIRNGKHVSQNS